MMMMRERELLLQPADRDPLVVNYSSFAFEECCYDAALRAFWRGRGATEQIEWQDQIKL